MHPANSGTTAVWIVFAVAAALTLGWCIWLGGGTVEKTSLALATSCASFVAGSILGFLFTIFGEELEPLGKIRDAMIALASGITGLSLGRVSDVGAALGSIHLFSKPDGDQQFSILFVLLYFVTGFYFMYFMRKLAFNPALAKSRVEMERISGSAGVVTLELGKKLPQVLLLGKENIEDVVEREGAQKDQLRADLFSDDVGQFLTACQKYAETGVPLQQEDIAKAATLHYYRAYFQEEETEREKQQSKAIAWINRALIFDPLNPDWWLKLADMFGWQERYDEAAAILERLERDDNSPQYCQQWLGYFLLYLSGRERDAIKHSLEFHRRFPDESDGLFNAACGHAQLYTIELRDRGPEELPHSEHRKMSLQFLREAIDLNPDLRAVARENSSEGESFASLSSDAEFQKLVDES